MLVGFCDAACGVLMSSPEANLRNPESMPPSGLGGCGSSGTLMFSVDLNTGKTVTD